MTSKLTSVLSSAIVDQRISKKEAKALIAAANVDGISDAERAEVKKAFEGVEATSESVAARLQAAFGADLFSSAPGPNPNPNPSVDLPDPTLNDATVQYLRQKGPLFVEGASSDDIAQGNIGDCYFLAAVASYAESHPGEIEKRIKDNGDGTYDVTFSRGKFERDDEGGFKWVVSPHVVRVDADLAVRRDGMLAYGSSRTSNELWVGIFEKAYAQMWERHGGFVAIGNGGDSREAMRFLDGGQYKERLPIDVPDQQLLTALKWNVQNKIPMTASTFPHGEHDYTGTDLVQNHAYSVLGVTERNNETFITLRNPWGHTEPLRDGKDDGRFELSLSDFKRHFNFIFE